jgi:anti-sigma-K factor RskA
LKTEEYISSGILESYALGELSAEERRDVEQKLQTHPELKAELERIEEAQEELLMRVAVAPRAVVRNNIFSTIRATLNQRGVLQGSRTKEDPLQGEAPKSISLLWGQYSMAAAIALILVSSFLAFSYYSKWRSSEANLNDLIAQNQRFASDYNRVNLQLDKIATDIRVINNPDFSRVLMKGTPGAPDAMAYVYWNSKSQEVFLDIQNLKALAQENQYQLWAIIDGKPVDAGVFDAGAPGLIKMKNLAGAVAFAVTVEPRGGKAAPTMETMQVIGYVAKG